MSTAACADARRSDAPVMLQDAGKTQPAAESGERTAGGSAASKPAQAVDGGAACSGGGSLVDYCAHEACPQVFSLVKRTLCETSGAQHQIVKNACSGMSALHHGGAGDTRYDYDEEGKLLGVTLLGGNGTCGGIDATYGQTCSVSGTPETFCDRPCTFIACASGLSIWLDVESPKDYQDARIKYCRNDMCSSARFNETIEATSGSNEIVFFERLPDNSTMMFMLQTMRSTPSFFVYFEAPDQKLKHGDHYLIEVQHPDGHELYRFDQTVDRYEFSQLNAPCTEYCKFKNFDSRAPSPDGSDSDAGAP